MSVPRAIRRRALAMICAIVLTGPAAAAAAGYVFVLQGLRGTFNAAVLEPAYIDGMALQIGWRDVEPAPGRYDWRRVDELLGEAQRRGKRVTLHVLPLHPPEWLFAAGVEEFRFTMVSRDSFISGRELREVIPWDPVFLDRWSRLTAELGKRYNANPGVLAVSVTAPAPEMVLPGAIPRSPAFAQMEQRYRKDVYLQAWKQMIDAYQTALPEKAKLLAPGIVLFDEYFADEVVSYARSRFGGRLWLFNAGLRADGVPQKSMGRGHIAELLQGHAKDNILGLQTIWSATGDSNGRMRGSLRDAIQKGLSMGASYFEIYAVDVLNPNLHSDLRELKRLLEARR